MTTDRHGLTLTGTGAEAAGHLDDALDHLLFMRPAVAGAVADALTAAPDAPLGHAFDAYLALLGTEETDAAAARDRMARYRARADEGAMSPRERAHLDAATAWLGGDIHAAGRVLGEVSQRWPRDALALAVGHQIDFFTGDAVRLRDRVGGALTAWDEQDRHHGPLLGMYAFGLEESGLYDRSEPVGLAAVAAGPADVWAIHAVVHTYEMQGRFAEGIAFLDARTGDWTTGNYLNVHNWWHYALYAIESGDHGRALEIYDAAIHNDGSPGVAMELLDASALLWRLYLAGEDVGDRWSVLAGAWAARGDGPYYAFNDTHAVMSYLGAGRFADAEAVVRARERWLGEPHPGVANHEMTARVGLPVARALLAYARGDWAECAAGLLPVRRRLHTYGGSHAQRDAIEKTLLEAALRAGDIDLARRLVSERVWMRPGSPYNQLARARVADRLGRTAEAAAARERAREQQRAGRLLLGRD